MSTVRHFPGEFGLKIRYHVPGVAAMGAVRVECEHGNEALFPFASEHILVERPEDSTRRQRPRRFYSERRFIPKPFEAQGVETAEVVVCPRWREYGSSKNWPSWPELVERLHAHGIGTCAVGAPDSSVRVSGPSVVGYRRFLDATIEAMLGCDLVIATDAGLAHLAVLCGRPLLLITHRGLVAPGPVLDDRGLVMAPEYWPVRFREYYERANHCGARIEMVDGWHSPESVVAAAFAMLTGRSV